VNCASKQNVPVDAGSRDTKNRVLASRRTSRRADIVVARALQICEGEVEKSSSVISTDMPLIIDIEILQVAKPAGLAQCVNRGMKQPDIVAARRRKHQLRLEAALNVDV
jgi:hypothetical protein